MSALKNKLTSELFSQINGPGVLQDPGTVK